MKKMNWFWIFIVAFLAAGASMSILTNTHTQDFIMSLFR